MYAVIFVTYMPRIHTVQYGNLFLSMMCPNLDLDEAASTVSSFRFQVVIAILFFRDFKFTVVSKFYDSTDNYIWRTVDSCLI